MSEPKDWAADVGSLVTGLGKNLLGVAARVIHAAVGAEPFEILTYRGYGNGVRAHVYGRVIEKRDIGASTDADSVLKNLLNTYRRADSDPLPFAHVKVEYAGSTLEMKADNEGFFGGWIELDQPITTDDEWQEYKVELVPRTRADPAVAPLAVKGSGEILRQTPTARFGVISDLDDTVIQSRVSNFLQAARTVMLGNARTRLPFPGVAAFYEALRNGVSGDEKNPIFYVSSSPWNIYDVIGEFMDIQKIPKGPLVLRDWDIGWSSLSSSRHFEHKTTVIRDLMQLYPQLEFILIGDTSQHDPEIYRQIVNEFPKRVRAIYIRDVTRSPERSASVQRLADEVLAANSTLVLSEDTLGAASHAAEQGWISKDALPSVHEEKRADEGKDDSKVATPDGGKPSSGAPPEIVEG
jgi:phosphatidate phosphatase APP1